jgi:hypothetical protein
MQHVHWTAATLLLLAHAVPAAQGTHPGPLPSPIHPEAGAGVRPAAEPPPHPYSRSFGTSRASGPAAAPPAASDDRFHRDGGKGWPGYPPAEPRHEHATGDYGSAPPPPPGGAGGKPRGYWKWVPAEPAEGYGYGPGAWPGSGYDDDYAPYAAYGSAPPYEGYGDAHPGGGFGRPGYGGYGQSYPAFGAPPRHPSEGYFPAPGYHPDLPGWASDAGPDLPFPAASDPPRGTGTGTP